MKKRLKEKRNSNGSWEGINIITPKTNNEWEEELVEKFASTEGIEMLVARTESIKSFIHSLLSLERQRLREEIEGMKKEPLIDLPHLRRQNDFYNQALSDILKLLEE